MSVKKVEGSKFEIVIKKAGEEIAKIKDHVMEHFKDAKVDGFREGKVPKDVIEKKFDKEIKGEVLNHIINNEYANILKENSIEPIDYLNVIKYEMNAEELEIILEVPIMPEINVGEYKGIKVKEEETKVTDENIEAEVKKQLNTKGKLKEIADDEAAQNDDVTNINFDGKIDGVAFDGGKAEGFDLTLGSKSFIDTFEDQIVGHKKDDEFDVNVNFPEQYHSEDLAGKPAVFTVKINSIKRIELPELNDEFAKELEYESLDDMKVKIKENLEADARMKSENKLKNDIIDTLIEETKIDTPDALVNKEIEQRIANFENQLKMQGMALDQYLGMVGQTRETLREQFAIAARKTIDSELILLNIADKENIDVTDEEIEKRLDETATVYGMGKDELVAEVKKANNYDRFVAHLSHEIRQSKTVDFLVKEANIEKN